MIEASNIEQGDQSVRPFRIHIPEEAISDLKRRLENIRWPNKETVDGWEQGVQGPKRRELLVT